MDNNSEGDSPPSIDENASAGPSSVNEGEGKVALDKNGVPKKKRKQLVACDSCRLRRVKCNKADIPGNGDCSSCAQKGIKCTDSYIRTKPKIVRSGKLIQQAKLLYGDGDGDLHLIKNEDGSPQSPSDSDSPHIRRGSQPGTVVRAAEARFLNAELARAISNSLIETYHEVIHSQLPVADWDHFQKNWDASGRCSEAMSPSGELLSLVMQAWGARFSDHPSILGNNAPHWAELQVDSKKEFSQYGQVRDAFARAMVDRAVRVMDAKGALRIPTAACAAALCLLEFILTFGDVYRSNGRHILVAAAEHLRNINEGLSQDPTEVISPLSRIGGDTLFWMVYTRDALSSAFGGRSTCLTQEDLTVLCELITQPMTANVGALVSSSDPRALSGLAVISLFRHLTTITRSCVTHVSGPVARRRQYNIGAVEQMWREIDQSVDFTAIFAESLNATELAGGRQANIWFRDLTSMRAQITHAIHLSIIDRLEVESRTRELNAHDPAYIQYIFALEKLKESSDVRFLRAIREVANMLRSYGSNLVLLGGLACENVTHYLEHMISMPEYEQGGIPSWRRAQKHQEIHWLVDACKLLGWCWPENKRHLERAYTYLADHFGEGRDGLPLTSRQSPPSLPTINQPVDLTFATGLSTGVPLALPSQQLFSPTGAPLSGWDGPLAASQATDNAYPAFDNHQSAGAFGYPDQVTASQNGRNGTHSLNGYADYHVDGQLPTPDHLNGQAQFYSNPEAVYQQQPQYSSEYGNGAWPS